jgi:hypothetical protein
VKTAVLPGLFSPVLRQIADTSPVPQSFAEKLAAYFKARPGEWIPAIDLEFAGRQAWRTRISDCRTQFGMRIDNRVRRLASGVKISEYRYVPEVLNG